MFLCLFAGYVRIDSPNRHTTLSFAVPKPRTSCSFNLFTGRWGCRETFSWLWSPRGGNVESFAYINSYFMNNELEHN